MSSPCFFIPSAFLAIPFWALPTFMDKLEIDKSTQASFTRSTKCEANLKPFPTVALIASEAQLPIQPNFLATLVATLTAPAATFKISSVIPRVSFGVIVPALMPSIMESMGISFIPTFLKAAFNAPMAPRQAHSVVPCFFSACSSSASVMGFSLLSVIF